MKKPLFNINTASRYSIRSTTANQAAKLCKIDQILQDAFGKIEQGHDYPYATGAEWSTHDLIFYLLRQIGPADLTAATWSVAEHAAQKLIGMLKNRELLSVNMLVDWRVQVRTPGFLPLARSKFSKISVSSCHAKIFVLQNEEWSISVVGSANFTSNPRIEAGHLSTSKTVADFHEKWLMDEINNAKPFGCDMRNQGKKDGRK